MWNIFNKNRTQENIIVAVADGWLIPIVEVEDEVFSKKIVGDGVAIKPVGNLITAPCDGTVSFIFPTTHAFGITMDNGIEVLVHIGLETVNLAGQGFQAYAKAGDKVKAGDKMVQFDASLMKEKGYDMTTMIIFTSCNDYQIEFNNKCMVRKGKNIVATCYK